MAKETTRVWLVFRADYVFDERLIRALIEAADTLLVVPSSVADEGTVAAVHVTTAHDSTDGDLQHSRESTA